MSEMTKKVSRWGITLSFLSAFLWSTTFIGTRFLLRNDNIDSMLLSAIRFGIAGVILFIIALFKCRKALFAVNLRQFFFLVALSLAGITGMGLFLFYGLRLTSAINGAMILAASPLLTMLLGLLVGETVTGRKVSGLIISLLGSMFVINIINLRSFALDEFLQNRGNILIFLSALSWAIYSAFGKRLISELGGFVTTTWVILLGAVEHGILLCFTDSALRLPTDITSWGVIAYIAIFPSALAFYAYYEAIRLVGLSLVNIMQYLTPACTIILAVTLLHEKVSWLNIMGIAVICVGIAVSESALEFRGGVRLFRLFSIRLQRLLNTE